MSPSSQGSHTFPQLELYLDLIYPVAQRKPVSHLTLERMLRCLGLNVPDVELCKNCFMCPHRELKCILTAAFVILEV